VWHAHLFLQLAISSNHYALLCSLAGHVLVLQEATAMFQEIQHAYAVLSDPHERRWYDDHREDILRGKGEGDDANDKKVRRTLSA
jgi:curved DNA-binding protein CbpA